MMVNQNFESFYKSVGAELKAINSRVRDIIGSQNWGEDGRYKEAILKNVISRFLSKDYSIGTGFVINKDREVTSQIDIIIYDHSSPVLFIEGDFVIVLASTVRAIIEVKTNIRNITGEESLMSYVKTAEENAKKINGIHNYKQIFNGIFAYHSDITLDKLSSKKSKYPHIQYLPIDRRVNNISLGANAFIHLHRDKKPYKLNGYELEGLSFAYFISNILIMLDKYTLSNQEHKSIFFPLPSKMPYEKFSWELV